MTAHARLRRIGWFALLSLCTLCYGLLHLQVWSVSSEVRRSERQIVALVQDKRLLETEFNTRANQMQMAAWNRVDFGYSAPDASQFIASERQLAAFGAQADDAAGQVLQLAAFSGDEEAPPFPRLVSPITGQPIDEALVRPTAQDGDAGGVGEVIAAVVGPSQAHARAPLNAPARRGGSSSGTVRVMLGGAGQ